MTAFTSRLAEGGVRKPAAGGRGEGRGNRPTRRTRTPRTQQPAPARPKLTATGHRIRKGHYNFTVTYENGRRIPGWYQGSGPVVVFATYFGYDVEWRNVPWAKMEHEHQAAA